MDLKKKYYYFKIQCKENLHKRIKQVSKSNKSVEKTTRNQKDKEKYVFITVNSFIQKNILFNSL